MIYALHLSTGAIVSGWPVDVEAALAKQKTSFLSQNQNQRGSLTLLNGIVYVPYGGEATHDFVPCILPKALFCLCLVLWAMPRPGRCPASNFELCLPVPSHLEVLHRVGFCSDSCCGPGLNSQQFKKSWDTSNVTHQSSELMAGHGGLQGLMATARSTMAGLWACRRLSLRK